MDNWQIMRNFELYFQIKLTNHISRMKKISILSSALLLAALAAAAQKPMTPPPGGKQISDQLIGIFFEDISMAADGGIYAEMVQNGAFEYNPTERDGWGPATAWRFQRPGHSLGHIEALQQNPLHPNNPNYMRINVERVGHYYDYDGWTGVGLQNDGFWGMSVKEGEKYDFSIFCRNADSKAKKMRVALVLPPAQWGANPTAIADATIDIDSPDWKQYQCTLVPDQSASNAALQILVLDTGVVDVDMVSLMPQDTYKGHGLRRDMVEALADLNPKFLRFPGGCVVHGGGDGFWDTYRWKTTIGPKEQRKPLKNTWGYHQSMGLGYEEYFQLCEDLGMDALPILPCGVSCQGTNGGWDMKDQAQDVVPMSEMDEWVQDALDLIEWANGSTDTKWGKVRADNGHPEPYGLKYLGIGNEERISPEFEERYKYMYDIIAAQHPEITIVGTAGPGSHAGNPDYDNGWRIAEATGTPILDEHYYEPRDYFINTRQYDNYPRDRKTKVYLGEYASKDKKLIDALAEALYLIHVERNGDVVVMTSYAPLFANKNNTNWNPDLIYFDNDRVYLTPSYYVQQMFGQSSGSRYYGDCVEIVDRDGNLQEQSVVLDPKARKLYIKVANASPEAKTAKLNLSRFSSLKSDAQMTILTAGDPMIENNYDAQPIAPVNIAINLKKKDKIEVPAYSFVMITADL